MGIFSVSHLVLRIAMQRESVRGWPGQFLPPLAQGVSLPIRDEDSKPDIRNGQPSFHAELRRNSAETDDGGLADEVAP